MSVVKNFCKFSLTKMERMHILQVGSNVIVCRDCEASDGVSIRTLVESCIRVKRFPQADVGVTRKKTLLRSSGFRVPLFLGEMSKCVYL